MTLSVENTAQLQAIFAAELGISREEVQDDLTYGDCPEWDSVGHMHLIAAIEETFDITFGDTEIGTLTSFALMAAAVSAKVEK